MGEGGMIFGSRTNLCGPNSFQLSWITDFDLKMQKKINVFIRKKYQ